MQISILSGIKADANADFRATLPRNLAPVVLETGISKGYLRPAEGVVELSSGPGLDRGGIAWNGVCHRVMGTKLVGVSESGGITTLGDVGGSLRVIMDYSFDKLGIASNGVLKYWDGSILTTLSDPDAGYVRDMVWSDGYWVLTDGEFIAVTDLNDPYAVNPLKYGSSESDPDPIMGLDRLRGEVWAMNRHSIEVFRNIGGSGFPFKRVYGALIPKGAIGTHSFCQFAETIAFVGSGRNEAPAVYLAGAGVAQRISTREVEKILQEYSEAELSGLLLEARVGAGQQELLMHLPNRSLVFNLSATTLAQIPIWYELTSSIDGLGRYRAQNVVWCYSKWIVGDTESSRLGTLVLDESTHYGEDVGWEFTTPIVYSGGKGATIHQLELVGLPGRVAFGSDAVVWTSYSEDGETWSQERAIAVGKQGQRNKRLVWFRQGSLRNYRVQKFRGTSEAHVSFARLEAEVEALNG